MLRPGFCRSIHPMRAAVAGQGHRTRNRESTSTRQTVPQLGLGHGGGEEGGLMRHGRTAAGQGLKLAAGQTGLIHGDPRPNVPPGGQQIGGHHQVGGAWPPLVPVVPVGVPGNIHHVGHHSGGGGQLARAAAVEHHIAHGVSGDGDGVEHVLHADQGIFAGDQMGGQQRRTPCPPAPGWPGPAA